MLLLPLGAVLLAVYVLPPPWGLVLIASVIVWEVVEKLFLLRYSRRQPIAVGREALIGLSVTAVSSCEPEGRVRLNGESWRAHCTSGAQPGDELVVEDVDLITLVVSKL